MNRIEAYEWLAPKLSLSEREVLGVIYNSPMDQSRMLADVWRWCEANNRMTMNPCRREELISILRKHVG